MICEKCEALNALIDGYRRERDEAWGEIEVLRASIEGEPWGAAVLKQERDEARAEVERLHVDREDTRKVKAALEVLIVKTQNELVAARAKAETYERDWYAAKADFGTAMAKMREALRAAEKERDAAIARITEVGVMVARGLGDLEKHAYRRGAEAMREACVKAVLRSYDDDEPIVREMRALPIPEEP